MNIQNIGLGVHVRVRELHATNPPPVSQAYLDRRKESIDHTGVIIKAHGPHQGGHLVWVRHSTIGTAPYWYSELDELDAKEAEVLESTGWEEKPLAECQKEDADGVLDGEREEIMPDIHITDFVRRQTPKSRFSHWLLSDEELLDRIYQAWDKQKPGYRDGVILVPVDPEGFFTGIVTLQEGDKLRGAFTARQKGESPRRQMSLDSGVEGGVASRKPPAVSVDIVLYRDDVLAEDGDQTGHEWNIISVNANPVEGTVPMTPGTMMANHFHDDGGTQTGMSDSEFVEALREAYFFWKDKSFIG